MELNVLMGSVMEFGYLVFYACIMPEVLQKTLLL